jgi:hypothetical protein
VWRTGALPQAPRAFHREQLIASCRDLCAQKSSQKSTRPRGAKDAVTFPGAIGRNNACVRADLQQVALGGRKRLSRVGECIVAVGGFRANANRCGVNLSLARGSTLPRGLLVSGAMD